MVRNAQSIECGSEWTKEKSSAGRRARGRGGARGEAEGIGATSSLGLLITVTKWGW